MCTDSGWRARGHGENLRLFCVEKTSNYGFSFNALLPGLQVLNRQLRFKQQRVNVARAASVTLSGEWREVV
jgi:hypothetical protein